MLQLAHIATATGQKHSSAGVHVGQGFNAVAYCDIVFKLGVKGVNGKVVFSHGLGDGLGDGLSDRLACYRINGGDLFGKAEFRVSRLLLHVAWFLSSLSKFKLTMPA